MRSAPAADETPSAPGIVRREEPRGKAAAATEQDEATAVPEGGCAAPEVDLRSGDLRLREPIGPPVARDVESAAALPEYSEAVGGERNSFRVAVAPETAADVAARA